MPFYCGHSLDQWLGVEGGRPVAAKKRALTSVARGLEYVHMRRITHCDVKPANVFMSSPEDHADAVVGDFDVSRTSNERVHTLQMTLQQTMATRAVGGGVGTLPYMAPELFVEGGRPAFEPAIDVYAFGVTIYEVLVGRLPAVAEGDEPTVLIDNEDANSDPALLAAFELVRFMVAREAAERPTMAEVLSSPFFAVNVAPRDMQLCLVCMDAFDLNRGGAACQSRHALCGECTLRHIETQRQRQADAEIIDGTDDDGRILCADTTCRQPIDQKQIVRDLTDDGHEALRVIQAQAVETRVVQEQRAVMEREIERVRAEGEVGLHVRHIVEQIATLRCPACQVAFVDFNGCMALKCGNRQCGRAFCGLCLADCGHDAHAHVARCRLNEWNGNYFVPEAAWHAAQIRRKRGLVVEYLQARVADEDMRQRVRDAARLVVPELLM